MIRSGYSFRTAFGHLPDVHSRLIDCGYPAAPLADRMSTFGFNRWTKLCDNAKIKPVYGVELAVVERLGEKKPTIDYWNFLAKSSLRSIHDLVAQATGNPGKDPSLTYAQVMAAEGVFKIAGERARLEAFSPAPDVFMALSPATPKGLFKAATERGHRWVALSSNFYPREEDKELYRVALGWRSATQTYPMHILNAVEWQQACHWIAPPVALKKAICNRDVMLQQCNANMLKAVLLKPKNEETLRELCIKGASGLNIDLSNPVYSGRLDRELELIHEKEFEDYFMIISDLVNWAKKNMIVGPARGSSCGSLVCYLLGITSIDPIPYGLIFERFIDINRGGYFFKSSFLKENGILK